MEADGYDEEEEEMKAVYLKTGEYEGRLEHARKTANLDALERISTERWAEPVAQVREEREIEALRRQIVEQQGEG